MHRNPNRSCNIRAKVVTSLVATSTFLAAATGAQASAYFQTDLTTDDNSVLTGLGYPAAPNVDPNLKNPWGISFGGAATPFWDFRQQNGGVHSLHRGWGAGAAADTARGDDCNPAGPNIGHRDTDRPGFQRQHVGLHRLEWHDIG
jgi:hypothetical protein